jgi:hypothetical protein
VEEAEAGGGNGGNGGVGANAVIGGRGGSWGRGWPIGFPFKNTPPFETFDESLVLQDGKQEVRIEHLLTHTSGLPAYTNAAEIKEQFGSPCPEKVILTGSLAQSQGLPLPAFSQIDTPA